MVTMTDSVMCFTCGFEISLSGRTADNLRDEHMAHDGAHEGSFYYGDIPLYEFAFELPGDGPDTYAVILPGVEPNTPLVAQRCADLASRFNAREYAPSDVEIIGTYRV